MVMFIMHSNILFRRRTKGKTYPLSDEDWGLKNPFSDEDWGLGNPFSDEDWDLRNPFSGEDWGLGNYLMLPKCVVDGWKFYTWLTLTIENRAT